MMDFFKEILKSIPYIAISILFTIVLLFITVGLYDIEIWLLPVLYSFIGGGLKG